VIFFVVFKLTSLVFFTGGGGGYIYLVKINLGQMYFASLFRIISSSVCSVLVMDKLLSFTRPMF
jgi:hypothetical protein